jgi:hypothetical protein
MREPAKPEIHSDMVASVGVSLGLRSMDGAGTVVRRAVDGVQPHRLSVIRHEIVSSPCGDDDNVAGQDFAALFAQERFAFPLNEAEDLVRTLVNLNADLPARCDVHQDELGMFRCIENSAKVGVFLGEFGYVRRVCFV